MFSFDQHVKGFLNTPTLKGLIKGVSDYEIGQVEVSEPNEIKQNKRLGKWAEFLFESIINHDQSNRLIHSNIQLKNVKQTIGEIDYLIESNNEIIHVELASKFYLLDESIDTDLINQWIGPNRKDFLHLKASKLKKRKR